MVKRLLFALTLAVVAAAVITNAQDLEVDVITCTTTATLAYTAPSRTGNPLVRNAGSAALFIGGPGVTTATGFELAVGAAVTVPLLQRGRIYCVVAAATQPLHVIKGARVP